MKSYSICNNEGSSISFHIMRGYAQIMIKNENGTNIMSLEHRDIAFLITALEGAADSFTSHLHASEEGK